MADPESTLQRSIEGYLIRGSTSKGFFADPAAFSIDPVNRDEVVLKLFESPAPLQVDAWIRSVHLDSLFGPLWRDTQCTISYRMPH